MSLTPLFLSHSLPITAASDELCQLLEHSVDNQYSTNYTIPIRFLTAPPSAEDTLLLLKTLKDYFLLPLFAFFQLGSLMCIYNESHFKDGFRSMVSARPLTSNNMVTKQTPDLLQVKLCFVPVL